MDRRAEITEKTERVVSMLAAESLGGVLLTGQHNFSWLTAGNSNTVDTSREAGACALVVRRDGRRFVLASRIEMARMLSEEISAEDFEPVEFPWEEEKGSPTFLADRALALLDNGDRLGSDLPVGPNARTIEGALARCRYRLTSSEIDRYRSLGRDAGEAIGGLMPKLKPGESEKAVARRARDVLAARDIHATVALVAADERIRLFRHPVPTDRRWERVLMVVVCARRGGLVASLTRIINVGPLPEELKQRTLAAARVDAAILAATRPGATGAELYSVAARSYATEGFEGEEKLHHQGGACGYRGRDWVAHPASAERVEAGQAFAWNPSITGTKVEETCIAYEENVELITASPGWPTIPVAVDGRAYLLPDVLSL